GRLRLRPRRRVRRRRTLAGPAARHRAAPEVPRQAAPAQRHRRPDGLRPGRSMMARIRRSARVAALLAAGALAALGAGSAYAAEGVGIDHVEPGSDSVRVLVSVPTGTEVELDSVTVTLDGEELDATAVPTGSDVSVERTTMLAIDTSNSMRGARFAAAKQAAGAFLSTVPDDVRVGVVSYAGEVVVAQEPTLD